MERNRKIIIGAAVGVIVVLVGLFIYGYWFRPKPVEATLEFWGVFDDQRTVRPLIEGFQKTNPRVRINYRQFTDSVKYEQDLVNALAAGKGPDVFMFHSSWLPKHGDKVSSLTEEELPIIRFRELFPRVVEQDFAPGGTIYALPLSVDTLALFYNHDDFDNAGISLAPKTWDDFRADVAKLRKVNPSTNEISKPAAAIGGSARSINRATDLLSLLMLQAGTQMTDANYTRALFSFGSGEGGIIPGLEALKFYTQFANPSSQYYTWDEDLHYSLDSFQEKGVSMIFNYAYQIQPIKDRNPFLKFTIAPMPQIADSANVINFANYWGVGVSTQSKNLPIAHQFIISATTDPTIAKQYAESAKKPPALRALINSYMTDPNFGVFAAQALTAKTWPQVDNVKVEEIFSQMIEDVTSGKVNAESALREAENKVTLLMIQKKR